MPKNNNRTEAQIQWNENLSKLPSQSQVGSKNNQNINPKCLDKNTDCARSSHQHYQPADNCYSTLVSSQHQTRVMQHKVFSEYRMKRNNNQPIVRRQFQNTNIFFSAYYSEHYQYQQQESLMTGNVTTYTVNQPFQQQILGQNIFDYNLQHDNHINVNFIEDEISLHLNIYGRNCWKCKALQAKRMRLRMNGNVPHKSYNYVQAW